MFKIGEIFTPATVGLEMICQLPKNWILDCRSTSKYVQIQMNHVFNMNGYIYTVRELTSGKNYKLIMKKSHKILNHHNEKEERDTDLMLIPEMYQMHEEVKSVKETIEEKANNKTKNIDLTQEKTKEEKKFYLLGSLVMIFLAIVIVILLAYGINHKRDNTRGVSV